MSELQAEALKPILKELLYELLIQEKDLLKELIYEVLEDTAMARAIQEEKDSNNVSRDQILTLLKE